MTGLASWKWQSASWSWPKKRKARPRMPPPRNTLVFNQTRAAVSVSSVALAHLEDDLHDIVDRVRASERMIEESRTLLTVWEQLFPRHVAHYHRPRLCPPGVGG